MLQWEIMFVSRENSFMLCFDPNLDLGGKLFFGLSSIFLSTKLLFPQMDKNIYQNPQRIKMGVGGC